MRGAATVEFEVRDAELALLSARRIDRPSPRAAIRLAVDLAAAGAVDDVTAVQSIRSSDIELLLHPQLQLTGNEVAFASGLPAAAGAAVGRIALSSDRAVEWSEAGDAVVLVAEETSPGDLPGMLAAKAIVTARGGLAAHAAVVARGLGRPAVCGATDLRIDLGNRTVTAHGHTLLEGAQISVDGSSGQLYSGAVHVVPAAARRRPGGAAGPRRRPAPATACGRTPTTAATRRSRCSTAPRASGCAAPSTSSSAIACRWSAGTCWPPTRPRRTPPSPSSPQRRRRTSSTCCR